jgi:hypothetical protein
VLSQKKIRKKDRMSPSPVLFNIVQEVLVNVIGQEKGNKRFAEFSEILKN